MDKIIFLDKTKTGAVSGLFAGMEDTTVWSCLQGRNFARAWTDDESDPSCAIAMVGGVRPGTGGFAFVAGDAASPRAAALLRRWKNDVSGGHVLVPCLDGWIEVIEETLGCGDSRHRRFATSKRENNFDRAKLCEQAKRLPEGCEITQIDRALFDRCLELEWARDNVGGFDSFGEFVTDGHQMGFVVLYDGEPVSVASPYSAYDKGIEIEIDTREDHRRRGLARACASRLILECLERGLYPSWDAANPESIALAQSLGYIMTEEYTAYFCLCGDGR